MIGRGPGAQYLGMFLQIFSDFSASCVCLSLACSIHHVLLDIIYFC